MIIWVMRSDTVPDREYEVTAEISVSPVTGEEQQHWHCDCPAMVECKHIARCKDALVSGMVRMYHTSDEVTPV